MAECEHILLVEDAASLGIVYTRHLEEAGFEVHHVLHGRDALKALGERRYAIALVDLQLPDMNGLAIIEHIMAEGLSTTVIVVTANGSVSAAVEAIRAGAWDFLVKPISRERLVTTVRNAAERRALRKTIHTIRHSGTRKTFHGFIGSSLVMQAVYRTIENVAASTATVFITGESGTGKEVCADAIHRASPRASGPFVAINCGAIPRDLIESEIFGHLKGSFTGAIADRDGAAMQANGGTLFLDEVCEMDLAMQTKLLRFLQTGLVQKVGGTRPEKVDVRIVCATNRDPLEEVRAGRFREDLYYRLHVIPVHLPPLRERQGDVVEIAMHLLERFAEEEGKGFRTITPQGKALLERFGWPGNVRQLQNVIRNVVVLNDGEAVTDTMIAAVLGEAPLPHGAAPSPGAGAPMPLAGESNTQATGAGAGLAQGFLGKKLWQIEKEAILQTVEACGGSIPKAAEILGVSPSTIYRKRESWHAEGSS